MKKYAFYAKITAGLVFLWLMWESWQADIVGLVGLGTFLIVLATWSIVRSKQIRKDYRAHYAKRKKSQRSFWTEPKDIYYYLHLFVIAPIMIGFGFGLIVLALYVQHGGNW